MHLSRVKASGLESTRVVFDVEQRGLAPAVAELLHGFRDVVHAWCLFSPSSVTFAPTLMLSALSCPVDAVSVADGSLVMRPSSIPRSV